MVDGEMIIEEEINLRVDETKLAQKVQKASEGIWSRIQNNHPMKKNADEVSPRSLKDW